LQRLRAVVVFDQTLTLFLEFLKGANEAKGVEDSVNIN
jgi:hypothetical protein